MSERLLLETRHLGKSFGSFEALRDVNLHIAEGDIYVLLGPNGSGKSTTLSIITGMLRPTSGEVVYTGRPGTLAGFIGTPPVYPHLSARANLEVSYLMRGLPVVTRRIDDVLATVGLAEARDRRAGEFSTGMRQRLGIGRALLFSPRLIVLDEPTNGLDPKGIVDIREIIQRLNRDHGITWLVSSHMLAEVEKIATRAGILMNGSLLREMSLDGALDNAKVFSLDTPEPEQAKALLPVGVTLLEEDATSLIIQLDNGLSLVELNRYLVGKGIPVAGLGRVPNRLEATYFQVCYGGNGGRR